MTSSLHEFGVAFSENAGKPDKDAIGALMHAQKSNLVRLDQSAPWWSKRVLPKVVEANPILLGPQTEAVVTMCGRMLSPCTARGK